MAAVSAGTEIAAPLAHVWELYFDPQRWAAWVDQFASVVSSEGYPEEGGRLVWRSGGAGRGEVAETVVEHRAMAAHRIEFGDPSTEGELVTTFEDTGEVTRVGLEMTYELRSPGLFARISDVLFVRSQMRASLERSLTSLGLEATNQ